MTMQPALIHIAHLYPLHQRRKTPPDNQPCVHTVEPTTQRTAANHQHSAATARPQRNHSAPAGRHPVPHIELLILQQQQVEPLGRLAARKHAARSVLMWRCSQLLITPLPSARIPPPAAAAAGALRATQRAGAPPVRRAQQRTAQAGLPETRARCAACGAALSRQSCWL